MDKKKSILNIGTSIFSKILLLLMAIFVRRMLIQRIGNDVNGLNSLYTSIIGTLAVAELGIGKAIIFSMYKPIVEDNHREICALYCLYKKIYMIIGFVIFVAGLMIMPFLPRLISDYENIRVNVYNTFLLMLISVVLTYLYSAKTSLIVSHKDDFIITCIDTISKIVRYFLQIVVILVWSSFTIYLVCQIISTLISWGLTEIVVQKRYSDVVNSNELIDEDIKIELIKNSKAMFMHKLGMILVNGADSMIISSFIGVVILGKYSNYVYIASTMIGIISLFFSSLTSIVGHLCAEGDKETTKKYFDLFYTLNYILGVVFFLGYFAVVDYVIRLLFGNGLEVSKAISFIITLSNFISYMRNAALLFRNASGTFYNDRWKPVAEGIVNVVLSILFVLFFPDNYKVVGVIVATIITTLLICDIVEPYVIYRYIFEKSPKKFFIKNYTYILIFLVALIILTFLIRNDLNPINGILINGFISVGISIITIGLVSTLDKSFRNKILEIIKSILS